MNLGECREINSNLRRKKQSNIGHNVYVLATSEAKPIK